MPFCLDYAVSFGTFATAMSLARDRGMDVNPLLTVSAGFFSGLTAAVALWPVDLVRSIATTGTMSTNLAPTKASFAVGLIPFSGAYLGIFFGLQPQTLPEKVGAAVVATTTALLVELPFDTAKHALLGGRTFEAGVLSAIRLPLATMLILVFDTIIAPPQTSEESPSSRRR